MYDLKLVKEFKEFSKIKQIIKINKQKVLNLLKRRNSNLNITCIQIEKTIQMSLLSIEATPLFTRDFLPKPITIIG